MTYDELLRSLNYEIGLGETNGTATDLSPYYALRAVVELHKPNECSHGVQCLECDGMKCATGYPCATIRAIEKELG